MKKGWEYKKLGEVCQIERGGSPRPIKDYVTDDTNGINWIKIGDTDKNGKYIYSTKEKIKPAGLKKSRWVEENDFLLSNSMSYGRPYILKTKGCIHDGWLVLRNYQATFIMDFLYYLLVSPTVQFQFKAKAQGSTVSNLNTDRVSKVVVAIPDKDEQQRIVSYLDSAFAKIDAVAKNAEDSLNEAKALFQSALTKMMEPKEGWSKKNFGDICTFVRGPFGGSLKKNCFKESGYAVYEQQNAIYNRFSFRYFIDEEKYNSMSRFKVEPGDLIMSCSGTIGKVAIVPKDAKRGIINQALLKLTPSTKIDAEFLKYLMESNFFKGILSLNAGGAAINNIASVSTLKKIELSIPTVEEQREIVKKLNSIKKVFLNISSNLTHTLSECAALKQSILRETFE